MIKHDIQFFNRLPIHYNLSFYSSIFERWLILVNFLASPSNPDPEKLSAYECGFDAFDDSRMEFDVRFYLVAILFIIFDLEIAFLFPWLLH